MPNLFKLLTSLPLEVYIVGQAQRVTLPAMDGINAPTILNPGCFPDRVVSNGEPLEWFHFRNAKHGHYVQGMVDLIQADLGNVNVYLVMGLFSMRLLKTSRVARE